MKKCRGWKISVLNLAAKREQWNLALSLLISGSVCNAMKLHMRWPQDGWCTTGTRFEIPMPQTLSNTLIYAFIHVHISFFR